MTIREVQLTNNQVAFSIWEMPDKSFHFMKCLQSDYINGNIRQPIPNAVFRMAAGGIPALNTIDGFPQFGNWWVKENKIYIAIGNELDWHYFNYIASEPKDGLSVVAGFEAASINNIISITFTNERIKALRNGDLTINQIRVKDGEIAIPQGLVKRERRDLARLIPNHKSVSFDAASGANSGGGFATSLTYSHTVTNTQTDLYIATGHVCRQNASSSATYNAVGETLRVSRTTSSDCNTYYYDLVNPATGAHNVVVTAAASIVQASVSQSAYGVDQTTPRSTTANAGGSSTSPSITFASAADELAITCLGWARTAGTQTDTLDAGWTQSGTQQNPSSGFGACSSAHKTGAASVTRTDTLSVSKDWALVGMSLKAASGGTTNVNENQNVAFTESVNLQAELATNESVSFSDAVQSLLASISNNETIGVAENASIQGDISINEVLSIADTIFGISGDLTVGETFNFTEQTILNSDLSVNDNLSFTENQNFEGGLGQAELVGFIDNSSLNISGTILVSQNETIVFNENIIIVIQSIANNDGGNPIWKRFALFRRL